MTMLYTLMVDDEEVASTFDLGLPVTIGKLLDTRTWVDAGESVYKIVGFQSVSEGETFIYVEDVTPSVLAQEVLEALRTRKGTDQEGRLSIRDIQKLKQIAGK